MRARVEGPAQVQDPVIDDEAGERFPLLIGKGAQGERCWERHRVLAAHRVQANWLVRFNSSMLIAAGGKDSIMDSGIPRLR